MAVIESVDLLYNTFIKSIESGKEVYCDFPKGILLMHLRKMNEKGTCKVYNGLGENVEVGESVDGIPTLKLKFNEEILRDEKAKIEKLLDEEIK